MKKLLLIFAMVLAVATSCKNDAPESEYDLFEGRWVATSLTGAPALTFVSDIRIYALQYITADPTDFEIGEFSISGDQITMSNLTTEVSETLTFKFSDNNNTLTLGETVYRRQTLE